MSRLASRLVSLSLALPLLLGLTACDPGDAAFDDDPPLSDYASLFDGAPSNDELPFEIKADGPPPRQHSDLVALQSPVKSQGSRGVCSIFSSVALMEHLYIAAGADDPDFSEQYLQWSAKFEVGSFPNSSGSNNTFNLQAVNRFGIPSESAWPYEALQWGVAEDPACLPDDDTIPTRCYTNGEPPQQARDAEKFFLPPSRFINSRRASIMDHIRVGGTGVVVGLDFFYQSWNHRKSTLPRNLDRWDDGIVLYPNARDIEVSHEKRAGHAVLLIGWDLDKEIQIVDEHGNLVFDAQGNPVVEKGFFLFKNSWGTTGFGIDNPHGAGYGWLSMKYVEDFGSARVADMPDLDLPPPGGDDGDDDGAGEGERFASTAVVPIPDATAAGITSEIAVDGAGTVGDVTVEIDIAHTWRGDLRVSLEHDGRTVVLHDKKGGGQKDLVATFDLADFAGTERAGVWTLRVVDTAAQDVGQLRGWAITLK